jgi:hypothetical protein
MRICFGPILTLPMMLRNDENTLRTDSQDYGVDEILYSAGIALFEKTIGRCLKLELFSGSDPRQGGVAFLPLPPVYR